MTTPEPKDIFEDFDTDGFFKPPTPEGAKKFLSDYERAEEILMLAEQIERKDQIAVKAIHDGQSFSEVLRLVRAPASSNPPSDSINHIKTD